MTPWAVDLGRDFFDYPVPENHRQISYLMQLAPRVSFEHRLALGASIAVGVVTVIVLVLGTDVGVARLGRRFGRGPGRRRACLDLVFHLHSSLHRIRSASSIVARKRAADPIGSAALGV